MTSSKFDPNAPSPTGTLFGLPYTIKESEVVVLPVPWEVTVSYRTGTARAPEVVKRASLQVDLYDPLIKDAWKIPVAMTEIPYQWAEKSQALRALAEKYISALQENKRLNREMRSHREHINNECKQLNHYVKKKSIEYMNSGKRIALLGGDHSTPLGLIEALCEKYKFSILQIDAHADLRKAYEGFTYSHASIMYNAIKNSSVQKLVQVGIRDLCQEEVQRIKESRGRIKCFYNNALKKEIWNGKTWDELCARIIDSLGKNVYISFDIDGLDPAYCPGTGTPVPGGLQFDEALYLIEKISDSGRTIIGFDLCEIGPSEWDGNVGARILYRLCTQMARSK